jgi:L-ascorbate metabolism protein UlaG (beta-lactamase superfamily)
VGPSSLTYVGGPTAILDLAGVRFLTDPTFDAAPAEYAAPTYTLRKTLQPAASVSQLVPIDAVLLSHDHHVDNLDRTGRRMLDDAPLVLTTVAGAGRLGGRSIGLSPWETYDVYSARGQAVRVTATPARHGAEGGDRGPVVGFVLAVAAASEPVVYMTGDTVWCDGVAEVARRLRPDVVLLFGGAARVSEAGPAHLTFTAAEAVTLARAFAPALIIPLHFEGWAHFTEGRADIEAAFAAADLDDRLRWPLAGQPLALAR